MPGSAWNGTRCANDRRNRISARDHAAFNLQVERVVREAKYAERRTFRDAAAMRAWVGERLGAEERTRLAVFLAAG